MTARRGPIAGTGRTRRLRRAEQPFARRVRDRRRRRHHGLRVLLLGVLGLVGLLLAGAWVVLGSSWLAVDTVVVEGAHRLSAAAVRQAAAVPMGHAMATLDRDAIAVRVKAALPPVAEVDVQRRWPGAVALVVTERAPAAALAEGTRVWLVDREGVAFAAVAKRPDGLPLITGMRTSDVDRLSATATVVSGLPSDLAALVSSASAASADAVVLHLTHKRTVTWGAVTEPQAKASVLRVLLKTATATAYDVSAPSAPTTRR